MIDIYEFLRENNIQNLLLNTTNEFLVEYNTLEENSLYKVTNFSGSTGWGLVKPDMIYLFVDGRYHIQADLEVDHSKVKVVKLQSGQTFLGELLKVLPEGSDLALFSKKHSVNRVNEFSKYYKLTLIDNDPLEYHSHEHALDDSDEIIHLDENFTGLSVSQKGKKVAQSVNLGEDEVILLTNLDDISYLFNLRNYSIPYSAKIKAKALIFKNEAKLFNIDKFSELEHFLKESDLKILVDPDSTNDFDYNLIKDKCYIYENPIPKIRSVKTSEELDNLKKAFLKTDKSLSAVRDYINNNENISEYDVEQKLIEEFQNNGALGLSFKPIIAKDKNSALAHYSKSSKDEIITEGSLVLIDCGAYFEGGLATDITRVFVKGSACEVHKKVYTLVLKAFLKGFNSDYKTGYEIDQEVRKFLNENAPDGFVFNHGLGHGIGINVHEYPPSLSNSDLAKVKIEDNMCFTIEPGLYKQGEFGVRLENSCYMKDGKICSFVNMNYEDKLIDYDLLNEDEKQQLKFFEVK